MGYYTKDWQDIEEGDSVKIVYNKWDAQFTSPVKVGRICWADSAEKCLGIEDITGYEWAITIGGNAECQVEKVAMKSNIGLKSGIDWNKAPEGATHYLQDIDNFYKKVGNKWVWKWKGAVGNTWDTSEMAEEDILAKAINKREDLWMNKIKVVKSIEDLEEGMFVFFEDKDYPVVPAYVHRSQNGIGLLFTNCNTEVNYTMQRFYEGLHYSPNNNYNITHWSWSLNGERYAVVEESEEDRRIKELQDTINKASVTLKEAQEQIKKIKGE
jgi:hypothetical protein